MLKYTTRENSKIFKKNDNNQNKRCELSNWKIVNTENIQSFKHNNKIKQINMRQKEFLLKRMGGKISLSNKDFSSLRHQLPENLNRRQRQFNHNAYETVDTNNFIIDSNLSFWEDGKIIFFLW